MGGEELTPNAHQPRDPESSLDANADVGACRDRAPAHSGARLDDGRYDAFVVWVEPRGEQLAFELTITTGVHKGEVIDVVASNVHVRDPLDMVGLPCTLVVTDGVPRLEP